MTDVEILDLLIQRQEDGLTYVKCRYEERCLQIANRILSNSEDAEEVVNDTWLQLWKHIPQERPANLAAYLFRITRNLALDRYRHIRAQRRGGGQLALALDELTEALPGSGSADSAIELQELAQALDRFLVALNQRDRGIFIRRYFYLESDLDIACRYGLQPSGVRTALSRTRKRLKSYLKKEGYL